MVEVVGTAPTSAMFITKFVYRYSWKSNMNNIKLYFNNSIFLFKITLLEQKKKDSGTTSSEKYNKKEKIWI